MHYVPESARELLPDESRSGADLETSFHYQSLPVYLLTAVVGVLLLADFVLGLAGTAASDSLRNPFGYRLALLAAVVGGARFLYQTLDGLSERRVGADFALTLAAVAAIALGEHETAALVVFVALCGESIEGFTVDRARSAIRSVFNLCPTEAVVMRDGREQTIAVQEVTPGDVIVVRPGCRIPADGRVASGESLVDESMLSGESLPVQKSNGSIVYMGSLNQHGSLTFEAETVGRDTVLNQIVEVVARAAEKKAPLERTADRLARYFLPAVLLAAVGTLIGWWLTTGEWSSGFRPALGVLVVACPCPLVLATPTAVMAAMAWLAREGVIVKGSAGLERLAAIDTLAVDKTGTLTQGAMTLGDVIPVGGVDADQLIRIAALAEKRSEHLLARLVVREAEKLGHIISAVDRFESRPGVGVVADVRRVTLGDLNLPNVVRSNSNVEGDFVRVAVGGDRLMDELDIELPEEIDAARSRCEESGQTAFFVTADQNVLGVIGVRDTVRSNAASALRELRESGVDRMALLTGDASRPAEFVAGRVGGFATVLSRQLPMDKARWIEQQASEGRHVAMIGDGVNDAPALATAEVGIALGASGTDLAAEAGDIVLMGDPFRSLPGLFRLSHALVNNIRQSIFLFAFGMNAVGVVGCAWGFLSPVAGAIFHEVSSLLVMANAMRLLWFESWERTASGRALMQCQSLLESVYRSLSPSRIAYRLFEKRHAVIRLSVAAMLLVWLTMGITRVGVDEQALVTRFGQYQQTLDAGWYWRWPAPFETVTKFRVDELRAIQLGFRSSIASSPDDAEFLPPIEWTAPHDDEVNDDAAAESLILTGDEVPVELTAEAQFRIAELRKYALETETPGEILRVLLEAELREAISRLTLDEVLTGHRKQIEAECARTIQARADQYGLGIELVSLNLLDVHPPRAVVPAYRDVADALEEQQQTINVADGYYNSKLLSAIGERAFSTVSAASIDRQSDSDSVVDDETWGGWVHSADGDGIEIAGHAAKLILEAQVRAEETVQSAASRRDRFRSMLEAYRTNPELMAVRLYWEMTEKVLAGRSLTLVDPDAAARQHLLLNEDSQLPVLDPSVLGSDRSPSALDEASESDGEANIAPTETGPTESDPYEEESR